ncbi:plastocyanin [Thermoflavifilum aggregans]|uniref:Plastocyanin n=1 Tax=Thermoflavifilum aggregans TaxID=454188 RepID=A0A2M9CWU5_9BACT|nr:cupredoxin family copper-binding protein [Thermoflavifilum aggregans]MBX6380129.1 cupredoxin family copper-binding protein [Thermoflavifilum aggregans]PJJ76363.1 plastocyanin [Thermoflavifilum aggregans]
MKQFLYLLFCALMLTGWAACSKSSNNYGGGNTGGNTGGNSGGSSGNIISISNYSFSPSSLTIAKGTTIKWTNQDPVTHTVTEDNGKFDSGNLPYGQSYSYTFSDTGTYHYHCSIHTYMKGTIVVQ